MNVLSGACVRMLSYAVGTCALMLVTPANGAVGGRELVVDGAAPSCSDALSRDAVAAGGAWCTLGRSAAAAVPGDTVRVRGGVYAESFRPSSGVRFTADGDVVLTATVKIVTTTGAALDGFTIRGAAAQGIWVDGSSDIALTRLRVIANSGPGIAVKASSAVAISSSSVFDNAGAGIVEYSTSEDTEITDNTITGNGRNGDPYNGDGVQVAGLRPLVARNTIDRNGDAGPYEHGIYAAATATDYVIESNRLSGNAAADIKAAGTGIVRYNLMRDAQFGLVLSDNPRAVTAYENVIAGAFQHAVLVTTGKTPAQAILWHNTIVQTGRSTLSGNASALFVVSATSLDLRNNVVCYSGPDNLGIAVWINSAAATGRVLSDTNWLCSTDALGRVFAWDGSRVSTSQWRAAVAQDGRSVVSSPPLFDQSFRALAPNRGAGLGQPLGLTRDFLGLSLPAVAPDIGAFQSPPRLPSPGHV